MTAMPESVIAIQALGLSAAGASDPGRLRRQNEDCLYFDVERGIFLVVDGVGGHAAGEVAASIAVDIITERLSRPLWTPEQRVRQAIALANNEIHRQAQQSVDYLGMTCVLTAALLTGQRLTIGHVGDTRLYKITPRAIVKVTRDHSPVGEQEDAGEISEIQAMHHPRRNEVFRDVGSAHHEPEDPEFVDLTEIPFEMDSAVLLCSDGLSDMLPAAAIERLIRQHCGDPTAVVRALIDAANEAGGKDNVTAIYVEGPEFRARTRALAHEVRALTPVASASEVHPQSEPRLPSRATWLAIGALAGLALAVATLTLDGALLARRSRTIEVGGALTRYASIGEAMAAAAPRDVIQVEPGEYAEAVVVKDGVSLVARVPGSVTLVARPGSAGWVSVEAVGTLRSVISGLRILGRTDAPIAVGMRLGGHDLAADDLAFEGNIEVGLDVQNDGSILVRSSRFALASGLPLSIGPSVRATVRQNLFVRGLERQGPAVRIAAVAEPVMLANTFVGYAEPIASSASREDPLRGNYIIRSPDHVNR